MRNPGAPLGPRTGSAVTPQPTSEAMTTTPSCAFHIADRTAHAHPRVNCESLRLVPATTVRGLTKPAAPRLVRSNLQSLGDSSGRRTAPHTLRAAKDPSRHCHCLGHNRPKKIGNNRDRRPLQAQLPRGRRRLRAARTEWRRQNEAALEPGSPLDDARLHVCASTASAMLNELALLCPSMCRTSQRWIRRSTRVRTRAACGKTSGKLPRERSQRTRRSQRGARAQRDAPGFTHF